MTGAVWESHPLKTHSMGTQLCRTAEFPTSTLISSRSALASRPLALGSCRPPGALSQFMGSGRRSKTPLGPFGAQVSVAQIFPTPVSNSPGEAPALPQTIGAVPHLLSQKISLVGDHDMRTWVLILIGNSGAQGTSGHCAASPGNGGSGLVPARPPEPIFVGLGDKRCLVPFTKRHPQESVGPQTPSSRALCRLHVLLQNQKGQLTLGPLHSSLEGWSVELHHSLFFIGPPEVANPQWICMAF